MPAEARHTPQERTVLNRETGQCAEVGGVSDTLTLTATVGVRAHNR